MSRWWWLLLAGCPRATGPTIAERFGDWPFLTPIDAPTTVALRDGGHLSATAASCGSCHTAVYAEWQQTTHAAALTDLQYLAELAKPDSPRWLCLNCHTPLAAQRPYLLTPQTRLDARDPVRTIIPVENPDFSPALQAEAITCATCHVRRDADGAGLVVGPTGSDAAPHRVRHDPQALRNICVRCHSPGPAQLTPTFVCWFETSEEGQRAQVKQGCVDCHMPTTERPIATNSAPRITRQHHWVGGGVPKSYDGYDTLLARGWEPGLDVTVSTPALGPSGWTVDIGLHNARAGHALPTADPERFLILEARIEADGAVLGRETLRIGQRWDWGDAATGRPATRLEDNRLLPNETRTWTVQLPAAPPHAALIVEAQHVRMTAETARYVQRAQLDAELESFRPGASADLTRFQDVYPFSTWIYATRIPLDGSPRTLATPPELIARSRAVAP